MADFDGDDDDDLAIGPPSESDGAVGAAGSVDIVVVRRWARRLRLRRVLPAHAGHTVDARTASEVGDQFGIDARDRRLRRRRPAGPRHRHAGERTERAAARWARSSCSPEPRPSSTPGAATMTSWMGEKEAWLGAALATGDVTGDGRADLVVGMPGAIGQGSGRRGCGAGVPRSGRRRPCRHPAAARRRRSTKRLANP